MGITRRQPQHQSSNTLDKVENGGATKSPSRNGKSNNNNTTTSPSRAKQQTSHVEKKTPTWVYLVLAIMILVTIVTYPASLFHPSEYHEPTLKHVFFYGWLTALSTGLGVLPFLFLGNVANYWVGASNAIAAGMMIAASYTLFVEGCMYADPTDMSVWSTHWRTCLGAVLGVLFLLATKYFMGDETEEETLHHALSPPPTNNNKDAAKRAFLVILVMTLHSFSEGVGVGVSFGGQHGSELGVFISASLAVHNIPEGLAIAVVTLPRTQGSILTTAVWAICTSLPQPLMAVPAYMFVHSFIPILPVGLGFAGGAMAWVAVWELLMEAIEEMQSLTWSCGIAICSLVTMLVLQSAIDEGARA